MSNGPEFQVPYHGGIDRVTLLDYFASVALQGMLANSDYDLTKEDFSSAAYAQADAMLEEREKR